MNFPNEKILDYCVQNSEQESDVLKELYKETHQKILNPIMLSGSLQGRFLSVISKMVRPAHVVEVGTYTGYSTLCLAEGLPPNGLINTIDINEELQKIQTKYFEKAGVENQINQHIGNALDIIPTLDNPIDLAFIDADKLNYQNYYELLVPKMRKGGIILSDNVLWDGKIVNKDTENDEETQAFITYNKRLAEDERVSSVILPFRDGITMTFIK